jgi:hypothetical protein
MFIGIAIVVIIAVVAGVMLLKPEPGPGPGVTTTVAPPPSGDGFLIIASPLGEKVTVENLADNKQVTLPDSVAPLRASLPPGQYKITLKDSTGREESQIVTLEAGRSAPPIFSKAEIDLDQAVEDVLNP